MTTQPNILVIFTDQQTQQAISAYGNPHLHTPNMDSLVHSGLSFQTPTALFLYAAQPAAACLPGECLTRPV